MFIITFRRRAAVYKHSFKKNYFLNYSQAPWAKATNSPFAMGVYFYKLLERTTVHPFHHPPPLPLPLDGEKMWATK
jgi:hypothetical protein